MQWAISALRLVSYSGVMRAFSKNHLWSSNAILACCAGLWNKVSSSECSFPFVHDGLLYCQCTNISVFVNDRVCARNYNWCELINGDQAFCLKGRTSSKMYCYAFNDVSYKQFCNASCLLDFYMSTIHLRESRSTSWWLNFTDFSIYVCDCDVIAAKLEGSSDT